MSNGTDTAAMAVSDEQLAEMLAGLEGWALLPLNAGERLGASFIGVLFNGMTPLETCLNAVVKSAGLRFAGEVINTANIRSLIAELQERRRATPVVSVKTMRKSDDRADYFVSIAVGDRDVTPHVFTERYKAEYHVAMYDWLLNGGEEPDLMAFGPDEWPATKTPALEPAQQPVGTKHPHWFAVHSVTGTLIGLWQDGHLARAVLSEYPGGAITELVEATGEPA